MLEYIALVFTVALFLVLVPPVSRKNTQDWHLFLLDLLTSHTNILMVFEPAQGRSQRQVSFRLGIFIWGWNRIWCLWKDVSLIKIWLGFQFISCMIFCVWWCVGHMDKIQPTAKLFLSACSVNGVTKSGFELNLWSTMLPPWPDDCQDWLGYSHFSSWPKQQLRTLLNSSILTSRSDKVIVYRCVELNRTLHYRL